MYVPEKKVTSYTAQPQLEDDKLAKLARKKRRKSMELLLVSDLHIAPPEPTHDGLPN